MTAVRFKLTHPEARPPTRATSGSVGYDVHACERVEIWPGESAQVRTGLALELPEPVGSVGLECQVRGRSGLAFKQDLVTHVGTIDPDYRGEIGVKLWNLGEVRRVIEVGDRIAQLVFAWVELPTLEPRDDLSPTERGAGGFGSTGT